MIDTHAHIYLPEFDADRQAMLQRAKDAGVKKIYLPNIDTSTIQSMLRLCAKENTFCYPMMGLHPCSVNENFETELHTVESYLQNAACKFYGIGECGLDYYWSKVFIAEQKTSFEQQILLAKKTRLPIIIHSREATDDCIALIAKHEHAHLRGIFHCFSGTAAQLEKIIALGFYAGIGGVVTFKNGGLDKVLQPEHLEHLVLETDAPYLAPVPYRGKRNEPAYVGYVAERLSTLLAMERQQVERVTTANALKLFGEL